jgi:alpha-beta hydrolase superfamily lysophospholipase
MTDANPLLLVGHSSGAHIAAMLLSRGVGGSRIGGFVAISGLYDLEPLRHVNPPVA